MPPTTATRRTWVPTSMWLLRESWPLGYHAAMKKFSTLLAAAALSACAAGPDVKSPDAALNALVEEYFDQQLELSPMSATAIGDSRFDDRLDESTSPGFREKSFGIERAYLDRAKAVDAAQLSAAARITLEIFVSEREQALAGQPFHEEYLPFSQMSGLPMDLVVYGSGEGRSRSPPRLTTTGSSGACANSPAGSTVRSR